jgi:hypothetical protein
MGHRLELDASGIDIRSAENHDERSSAVLFRKLFDSTLNLKVQRAGGGSDKALGGRVNDLASESFDRLLDGVGGHTIALAQNNHFLPSNIHSVSFAA